MQRRSVRAEQAAEAEVLHLLCLLLDQGAEDLGSLLCTVLGAIVTTIKPAYGAEECGHQLARRGSVRHLHWRPAM